MKNKKNIIKKILIIFICFMMVIGIGIFTVFSTVTSINKVYSSKEIVVGNGEKQAILIYEPSKSSLSENVALKTADLIQQKGYTVTINYPSNNLKYNLNEYDVIVFGSPVYARQISPVLKEYIQNNPIENKKIILYTTGKFEDNKVDLDKLKNCVKDSNNTIEAEKYTKNTEETFWNFIEKSI